MPELIWIIYPESNCIFKGTRKTLSNDPLCGELAPVVIGDLDEIVLILKRLGWSARDVLGTKINIERPTAEV